MLSHPVCRLIAFAAAVALMAAAGGAASAGPGGGERTLEPTAQLATDGGVSAPAPATGGGMAAPPATEPVPAASPAPATPVPPDAPPAPTTTSPTDEALTEPAPAPTDAPAAETGEDTTALPPAEEPEAAEPEPVEPPTMEEALGADQALLVPAEMLPVATKHAAGSPLIDISPAHVAAEPLRSQPELAAAPAQEETPGEQEGDQDGDEPDDDDEVVIPVPIDGDDENGQDPTQVPAAPAPVATEGGPALPSTGRELLGPAASAMLLLLAGVALRLAAGPSASPARA